ncbi:hypothetical protein M0638_23575 [Roseomonas sp. NAR14]|uniref:Uncharacterized protein n=1 Tax=Roseomonas acroporae TaxID=2937791 RepID=A0A9X1YC14_9PROT|nr:hypothetical protein [Roseomonas acroporae]MCK8787356.1 hypothetical protein [Roseomonas acroporae]
MAPDRYAGQRRRVLPEVVAPTANGNKRRLMESDPGRRCEDVERLARLNADPALPRAMLLATRRLVSKEVPG